MWRKYFFFLILFFGLISTVHALEVSLIYPEDGHLFHTDVGVFSCNATGGGLKNMTLYINGTANQTQGISGSFNRSVFEVTGNDIWVNWTCEACDDTGCAFGENRLAFINTPSYCGGTLNCSCGDTLNVSWNMPYDMECNGTALYFGASSLTLNCSNHTIKGNGTGEGLDVGSRSNNIIKWCNTSNFRNSIKITTGDYNTVNNSYLHGSVYGFRTEYGAYYNIVENCEIYNNSYGLDFNTANNKLRYSHVYDNGDAVVYYDACEVYDNIIENNSGNGFYASSVFADNLDAHHNLIRNNGNGFQNAYTGFFNPLRANFTSNVFDNNTADFSVAGDSVTHSINNTFDKNKVSIGGSAIFHVWWYFKAWVTEQEGIVGLPSTSVNISDVNGNVVFIGFTDVYGYTSYITLKEYDMNSSLIESHFDPYTINISKGYYYLDPILYINRTKTEQYRVPIGKPGGPGIPGGVPTMNVLIVSPSVLDIYIRDLCNRSKFNVIWNGLPVDADIYVSANLRDVMAKPKHESTLSLEPFKSVEVPVEVCSTENITGYITIRVSTEYVETSQTVKVNVIVEKPPVPPLPPPAIVVIPKIDIARFILLIIFLVGIVYLMLGILSKK